jgi:hypothetical protein
MTDDELVKYALESIHSDSVDAKNTAIKSLCTQLVLRISQLKSAKSSMIDVLFSVDEEDDERLAWAIQCVRDDFGDANE